MLYNCATCFIAVRKNTVGFTPLFLKYERYPSEKLKDLKESLRNPEKLNMRKVPTTSMPFVTGNTEMYPFFDIAKVKVLPHGMLLHPIYL